MKTRCDLTVEDRWFLLQAYVEENGLVKQHINSYNDFVQYGIHEIIKEFDGITISTPEGNLIIKFGRLRFGDSPDVHEARNVISKVTPMEARLRNLTYATQMELEIFIYREGSNQPIHRDLINIGRFPVMVKSVLCPTSRMSREELIAAGEDPEDPGGYFIINGSERCIVPQEDLAFNYVLVDYASKGSSATHIAKTFSSVTGRRGPVVIERLKDGTLHVSFYVVPSRIPLFIMMRALGLETDKEIVEAISTDPEIQNELYPSLEQAIEKSTVEDALDYIGARVAIGQTREARIQRAELILDNYLLPHLGSKKEDRIKKAYFLGQMAEKLLELVLGRRKPDDKDHYMNKRVKLAGELLALQFRVAFKQLVKDLVYQLEKYVSKNGTIPYRLSVLVKSDIITERLRHALATGNWVGGKTGVSQLLDRTCYMATLSHMRRVVSPLSRSQPHFEARDLHPTQWGRLCPNESPEGPNCGLVKNLALYASISRGFDEKVVERLLFKNGVVPIVEARRRGVKGARVYLDGRLIGVHPNGRELVKLIRTLRRSGKLNDEINISRVESEHFEEVHVCCDRGRIRRPLLVLENGEVKLKHEHVEKLRKGELSWSDLVKAGLIEYLDALEEDDALVAVNPEDITEEHTHMEIIPNAILGVAASLIPFAEHNQSTRNTFEAVMAKQALGLPYANITMRLDSRAHLLHYPQVPIVKTRAMDIIGYTKRPAGQNFVVAILSYTGYNIEDAIILNRSAIERGLARSTFFRTYEAEEHRYPGGEEDRIENPLLREEENLRTFRTSKDFQYLEEDGIAALESYLVGGQVLIGKTSPPRFIGEYREFREGSVVRRDSSISIRHGETAVVDRVLITETSEATKLVKVRVRDERVPEIGDKFASRHGQKGVIGLVLPEHDMPFTEDGVVPDLIINPHAIPSRMTIGQLIESIAGKVGALEGRFIDGSPFVGEKENDLREALMRLGFEPAGTETLYDGRTGRMLKAEVFIGIVYYQKLHHMVKDKIHARSRGPVQILTRQPTEGRAREGGLRFGEMERDCLIGHGASALLRERLLEESDKTTIYVCDNDGMMAYYDAKRGRFVCPLCGEKATVSSVEVSYAFKLLLQELMSLGIFPKLRTAPRA